MILNRVRIRRVLRPINKRERTNQLVELPRGHEFIVAKGHDIEAFKGRGGKAKL